MRARSGAGIVLAGLASLCFIAPAGAATAEIGRIAPMGVTGSCGGCTFFQLQTDPASPSYVVPPGGPWTITSWRARGGGTTADSARLRVFRPTPFAGRFQLVAESAETPIGVVEAPVNPVSIAVEPGDRIGLRTLGVGDLPGTHPSASAVDQLAG